MRHRNRKDENERLGVVLTLTHAVKENLVERAQEWPGVHCVRALLKGEPLTGHWFNRSREYAARNERQEFERLRYATEESVTFSPIPCWAHLSPELHQRTSRTWSSRSRPRRSRRGNVRADP